MASQLGFGLGYEARWATCGRQVLPKVVPLQRVVRHSRRVVRVLRVRNTNHTAIPSTPTSPSKLPLPDGPFSSYLPVVGETLEMMEKGPLEFFQDRASKFGPVFRLHYLGKACYMVGDYVSISKALYGDQKLTRIAFPEAFNDIIGPPSFMTDKAQNQILRRQVGQAFGPKAMSAYSKDLSAIIEPALEEAAVEGSFDVYKLVCELTVDFSTRLVAGLPVESAVARETIRTEVPKLLLGAFSPLPNINLPGFPYYEGLKAREAVLEVMRPILGPRKAEIMEHTMEKGGERNFLTQMLMAKMQGGDEDFGSDNCILETVLSILLAAFDTSKTNLVALLAILALAPPHVVEKLRAEQREIIAKHGNTVSGVALAEMHYAEGFAKEGLRAFPSTPMLTRVVLQDFELHGRRIPAGSTLHLNLMAAARDESVIPLHERGLMFEALSRAQLAKTFRPERWVVEAAKAPVLSAFGLGPHFCLGAPLYLMEAKALLAVIVRRWDISCNTDVIEFAREGLAVPKEPLFLTMHQRK